MRSRKLRRVRLAWRMRTDEIVTGTEVLSSICCRFSTESPQANWSYADVYQLDESLLRFCMLGVQPRIEVILLSLALGRVGLVF